MPNHPLKFKTPEEAKAFLRKVIGPPTRELDGEEKRNILLLLKMIQPFKETNNQRSWTEYYMIGPTEYHLTYWPGSDDPTVEVMLDE